MLGFIGSLVDGIRYAMRTMQERRMNNIALAAYDRKRRGRESVGIHTGGRWL
jgi:hypothetical protein